MPSRGGSEGSVTALIHGNGFVSGATVTLHHAGASDIAGNPVFVDVGGSTITATFDLGGAALGARDVVVLNPDGASAEQRDGFVVEPTEQPRLWADIIGSSALRGGRPDRYFAFFGNRGNVDAIAVPLGLVVPRDYLPTLEFEVLPPPPHASQVPTDWEAEPITVVASDRFDSVELLLPVVPAGFTGTLAFTLQPPSGLPDGTTYFSLAGIDPPILHPDPDSQLIASLAGEAQRWAQEKLGVTIPVELLPDVEQYVTAQLLAMVASGRTQFAADAGTEPPVYSQSQLTIDAGQFAAARARMIARASSPVMDRLAGWFSSTLETLACLFRTDEALAVKCLPGKKCKPRGPKPIPTPPGGPTHEPACSGGMFFLSAFFGGQGGGGSPCMPNPCKTCTDDGNGGLLCSGNECSPGGGPVLLSHDPNDKVGPVGVGAEHFVTPDIPLAYAVSFENVATASGPAQDVVITDQLDPSRVDLDSFSLGPISVGELTLFPPPGSREYTGGADLRPEQDLLLTVDARLDPDTGLVTWRFSSIDPQTQQHTEEATAGFLPPNVNPPQGQGSVVFTVQAMPELATGTQICNQASIVFDVNAPIDTPQWCNTIDRTPPQSHVLPLPARQRVTAFDLEWEGTDSGAGIGDFSVYVSEDGGAYAPLVSDTNKTTMMFVAEDGKRYAFCSRSRDRTGTLEDKACPGTADTNTVVSTAVCIGDCDYSGIVNVNELVRGVNIALDRQPVSACAAFDRNHDDKVGIDELIAAVGRALNGCGG